MFAVLPARACASAIVKWLSLYWVMGVCSLCLVFPKWAGVSGLSPRPGFHGSSRWLLVPGGAVAGDVFGLGPEGFAGGGEVRLLGRSQDAVVGQGGVEVAVQED